MRGLIFLIITATVCTPLWFLGVWIYRRPEIKRNQIKALTAERDRATERAEKAEDTIQAISMKVDQHQSLDPLLAQLVKGLIEQHETSRLTLVKGQK